MNTVKPTLQTCFFVLGYDQNVFYELQVYTPHAPMSLPHVQIRWPSASMWAALSCVSARKGHQRLITSAKQVTYFEH